MPGFAFFRKEKPNSHITQSALICFLRVSSGAGIPNLFLRGRCCSRILVIPLTCFLRISSQSLLRFNSIPDLFLFLRGRWCSRILFIALTFFLRVSSQSLLCLNSIPDLFLRGRCCSRILVIALFIDGTCRTRHSFSFNFLCQFRVSIFCGVIYRMFWLRVFLCHPWKTTRKKQEVYV